MRFIALLLALAAMPAARAAPPAGAALLYAERAALLAGDAQCHLLSAPARAALIATAAQARYAALRAGWTAPALDAAAARPARPCADRALRAAAQRAMDGFRGWAALPTMQFPGALREWSARHVPDADGWTLFQALPGGAKFGLARNAAGAASLVLALPAGAGNGPGSACLFLRDRARAPRPLLGVPAMNAGSGLAAGLAPRSLETARLASGRLAYRPTNAAGQILFLFPAGVLDEIAALDPRETIEIELAGAGAPARVLIEIGDLAAARAFVAAGPG